MSGLAEHPGETIKLIVGYQMEYVKHPVDTVKLFIESWRSLFGAGNLAGAQDLAGGGASLVTGVVEVEPTDIEELVLVYTNRERANNGLAPLVLEGSLAIVARNHSQDMFKRNFFAHDNPDGQGPTDRFVGIFGYIPEKEISFGKYIMGVGENLGKISTPGIVEGCGSVSDADSVASCQVYSWMESPTHRANILNQKYTHLGVGSVRGNDSYYITQVFW